MAMGRIVFLDFFMKKRSIAPPGSFFDYIPRSVMVHGFLVSIVRRSMMFPAGAAVFDFPRPLLQPGGPIP
jgi:hypothetical protein